MGLSNSRWALIAAFLWLVSAGCGREAPLPPPPPQKLVVFAAASLREAFTAIGDALKQTHPGLEITFNFAGSQELRTKIEQGAIVDVFASADGKHMAALEQQKTVAAPKTFARNEPVVVIGKAQAATLHAFADLPAAARIVLGVPEVPIGRYSLEILDKACQQLGSDFRQKVEAHVVSREFNVRQVLAKVSLGEADAAIVYRTDVKQAENVVTIEIPKELNVIASYPIATLTAAPHAQLAREFVDHTLAADGQQQLAQQGFLPP